MTVCVGFLCRDGIVLASDTQYTKGPIKTDGPKLFRLLQKEDVVVVAAGAGTVIYMKRVVEKLEISLNALLAPGLEETRATIEDVFAAFYQQYIKPLAREDQPSFEFLFGVWALDDGFGLFKAAHNVVSKTTDKHATIGIGHYVTGYTLGVTLGQDKPTLNVDDARVIAAICIRAAKDYVEFCGGRTEILTLRLDDETCHTQSLPSAEIADIEQYAEEVFDSLRLIWANLGTGGWEESTLGVITDSVKENILASLVNFHKKQNDRAETAAKLLQIQKRAAAKKKRAP